MSRTFATALCMIIMLSGCGTERHSKLDDVRRACLRIQSRTELGINKLEYPTALSEVAYQILLARDMSLDNQDATALKQYEEALASYASAKDVWDANQNYNSCLEKGLGTTYCKKSWSDIASNAARAAHVNSEVVFSSDAVQSVWLVAEQKVKDAEQLRHSVSK